jgi:dihydroxyacetone kinase-like predicted kinase
MSSVITVICGQDVQPSEKEKFVSYLQKKYGEDIDIDVKDGNQPVYSFIIGVE